MGVSSHLHAPAALNSVPLNRKQVPTAGLDVLEKRKYIALRGFKPRTFQPVARRCTDYANPDTL